MITIIYPPIIISGERIDAQLFPSGLVSVSKKKPMNIDARPMMKVIFFLKACFAVFGESEDGLLITALCSLFVAIYLFQSESFHPKA